VREEHNLRAERPDALTAVTVESTIPWDETLFIDVSQ
jgi:hypothetical protein